MHTTGWGGVIGLLLMLMMGHMHMNVSLPLVVTFFVAGIVATSRLILSAHTPAEIYAGFMIGILSQWIAYGIVG
jgi:membrane-associated phospholipid phosphatase